MFRRNIYQTILASLFFAILIQNGSLRFAEGGEPAAIGSKLNRDSFLLTREIRNQFRGIRGQRIMFDKAYEIHEVADDIQSMIIFNEPAANIEQAVSDLNFLVEDFGRTIQALRLPVFRDPVITPTGPNGYTFSGGNGYPQPNFHCGIFQCFGPPYRMVPEQSVRNISLILKDMKSSINQLQVNYAPKKLEEPKRQLFPLPSPAVPQSDTGLRKQSNPNLPPVPYQKNNTRGWKRPSKTVPVLPPVPSKSQTLPPQKGPAILPPLPPNE